MSTHDLGQEAHRESSEIDDLMKDWYANSVRSSHE